MPIHTLAFAIAMGATATGAAAGDLVVLAAGAVKEAFPEAAERWQKASGTAVKASFAPAGEIRKRLAAHEAADILVLPADQLAALEREGVVVAGTRRDFAAVGMSAAVRKGAPLPDISTVDALKRTLLAAKSVTYMDPALGTSGRHFDEKVLPRLGIRDAVRAKTRFGKGGSVAVKLVSGEAEIAFQNTTELLVVPGAAIVGPLPAEIQLRTVYSGAVLASARDRSRAQSLLDHIASAEGRRAFLDRGFNAP
jgi:molybdate transport system substrate-binding protein